MNFLSATTPRRVYSPPQKKDGTLFRHSWEEITMILPCLISNWMTRYYAPQLQIRMITLSTQLRPPVARYSSLRRVIYLCQIEKSLHFHLEKRTARYSFVLQGMKWKSCTSPVLTLDHCLAVAQLSAMMDLSVSVFKGVRKHTWFRIKNIKKKSVFLSCY